jgi:hypothetical protein
MLACTGHYITDTVTALKLFPRTLLPSLALETTGFETDHEITAKVLAAACASSRCRCATFRAARTREEDRPRRLVHRRATFWKYRNG